jgi:GAF domain-containing protein
MMIIRNLKPSNVPDPQSKDVLSIRREIILQHVLNILLAIYSIGLPIVLIAFPQAIRSGHPELYAIPFLFLAGITLFRRIPYIFRAVVLILALIGLGSMALVVYGLGGTGVIFLLGASFLASILFDRRAGIAFTALAVVTIGIIGALMVTGRLPLPQISPIELSGSAGQWAITAAVFIFIMLMVIQAMRVVVQGLNSALREQEKLTRELQREQDTLEQRVAERSAELRRRVEQFEIASQVAREISGETDLERLLNTAANLIRDRFGFYHVGIFLNDEKEEFAVLRAATGEAGRQMLERGHRLKIGEIGIVGNVVSRGEARITMDVMDDVIHYKNPLLPETRSELALPLRSGEHTIGALDVQSVEPNAFSQEDVRILQTIGDQLAIAFQKTRLVDQLSHSLEELNASQRVTTFKAWRTHLRNTRQKIAYRYRDSRLDNQVTLTPYAQEAQESSQPVMKVVSSLDGQGRPISVLAVPIKVRNQVLGVVDIQFAGANVSPDLISLIEGTVNRLAVSLENARLLEEIQFRAERERLVSEISSKVRAAPDIDNVMRIAVQEIGKSLGVSEVMIQLRKES